MRAHVRDPQRWREDEDAAGRIEGTDGGSSQALGLAAVNVGRGHHARPGARRLRAA